MAIIRKATQSDSLSIIDFQTKMAWETESLKLDLKTLTHGVNSVFLNPSKGQYFVAEDSGKIIASLLITYEWSDWRNTSIWWIQSVYVTSEFRRKGIFRSMFTFIKEEAGKNKVAGLRLYVELNNIRAQKTYKSLGMNNEHYFMFEWLKDQ